MLRRRPALTSLVTGLAALVLAAPLAADSVTTAFSTAAPAPTPSAPNTSDPAPTYGEALAAVTEAGAESTATTYGSTTAAAVTRTTLRGSASSHAFLAMDSKGRPAHWNRCAVVRVRVNTAGMPRGGLDDVKGVLARLNDSSGLRFVLAGGTIVRPYATKDWSKNIPSRWRADVYIGWNDAAHVPSLAGSVAGIGGPIYRTDGSREPQIVTGALVMDREARVKGGFGAGVSRGTLILHEMGHVANLAHVKENTQVMYPAITSASTGNYQRGDRAGLVQLSRYGCF